MLRIQVKPEVDTAIRETAAAVNLIAVKRAVVSVRRAVVARIPLVEVCAALLISSRQQAPQLSSM